MELRSPEVTQGFERAPARAMLRAVGMRDEDWEKPQVGVASSWNEVTPCNMPLDRLADRAKDWVRAAGGFPLEFATIAVSDGISMGHEGMRASLVSREVIADSVETVMHAERFDAMVTFAGCDKSLPGMLMAAARLNLPSVFVYGGSILPGEYKGQALENAIAVTMALGGSTNAVLHLLAIANEARVELALEDFNRVAARVPHIADMKPHGKYHMVDLDKVGGVPVVMQHLLDAGLLHGDCVTVTGKTVAENLAALAPPAPDGSVVHPLSDALHPIGGLAILTGSLAPKGSVVK